MSRVEVLITLIISSSVIGAEDDFQGVVDVVKDKAFIREEGSDGTKVVEVPIPEDLEKISHDYRMKLIEGVAEESDELLEK